MNWTPIIILAAINLMSVGLNLERHGKKKEGTYDAGTSVIGMVVVWGLLWWAGIFDSL